MTLPHILTGGAQQFDSPKHTTETSCLRNQARTVSGDQQPSQGGTEMTSTPSSGAPAERVHFRDVKPYAIVDSLDLLRGPASGTVELSHSVLWAPGGRWVDLDEPGGTSLAYQAVLAEGDVEDLVQVLDRGRLISAWPELMLPLRLRRLWEARFPELRPTPGRAADVLGAR